jgi:hypothetical protein
MTLAGFSYCFLQLLGDLSVNYIARRKAENLPSNVNECVRMHVMRA